MGELKKKISREKLLKTIESGADYGWSYLSDYAEDKEVMLAAVRQAGNALKHASLGLRNDKDVVMAAYGSSKLSLYFASTRFREDVFLLRGALDEYCVSYRLGVESTAEIKKFLAESDVKNSLDFFELLHQKTGVDAFWFSSDKIRANRGAMAMAIERNIDFAEMLPESLRDDKELAMRVMSQSRFIGQLMIKFSTGVRDVCSKNGGFVGGTLNRDIVLSNLMDEIILDKAVSIRGEVDRELGYAKTKKLERSIKV